MSSATPPPGAAFAMSTRILGGALMGALVVIGLALAFVLPIDETPPLWVPLAQVAAGVGVHFVLETIGYRVQPLEPSMTDDEAVRAGRTRWQSAMIIRFTLSEFIAIASIAAAFVLPEGGFLIYAVAAIVSLALMAVHVWPGARPVGKTADALEAHGRASQLREAFGLPSSAAGGPQRL